MIKEDVDYYLDTDNFFVRQKWCDDRHRYYAEFLT